MAIIDLGKVSITWRGTYAGGTAYTPKDAVVYNNASYICIANTTGNLPTDTTYWNVMAAKGVDGTDLTSTLTTQGDIVYRDGSGLQRLAAGTNGQLLKTGGSGANVSWTDAPSGVVKQIVYSEDTGQRSTTSSTYTDASNTLALTITPTSSSAKIWVQFQFTGGGSDTNNRYFYTIQRSTGGSNTDLGNGGNGIRTHEQGGNGYQTEDCQVVARKDEPNTTSAVVYHLLIKIQGGTGYINTNGIASGIAIEYA